MGEGVAHLISFGLRQHPAIVQIARERVEAAKGSDVWSETVVSRVARDVSADVAIYGRISRKEAALVLQPILVDVKRQQRLWLPPVTTLEGELETRVMGLPAVYARALQLTVTDSETSRMARAARATHSIPALELFTRGQAALDRGAYDQAVDALAGAVRSDPRFVMAHQMLGIVHMNLGNRWKAAAQFRTSMLLDPTMPEPLEALGDLFLAQPNRLFDMAIEAYTRAIALRPSYAEAHLGLGDARMANGDVDGALAAYRTAVTRDPFSPRAYLKLAGIYATKGLCEESATAYRRAAELDRRSTAVPAPCGHGSTPSP